MVENQSTSIRKYPKRIPYGMMNFKAVIEDDCYYVDKTPFVEKIERANKFFFYPPQGETIGRTAKAV